MGGFGLIMSRFQENLLNKVGTVLPDGKYESWIPDNDMRFSAYIAELVGGRVGLTGASICIAKLALTIAIRYALQRRQFGSPGNEIFLLDYPLHQMRLIPLLATTYAMVSASFVIQDMWISRSSDDMVKRFKQTKEVHIIASGLKAVASWHQCKTLQQCREACGGQGFKSNNRIGIIKGDTDAFMTYEGDNFVLLGQVAKQLVKEYSHGNKTGKFSDRLAYMRTPFESLPADVNSERFQVLLFQMREREAIKRVISALNELEQKGIQGEDAWNEAALVASNCGKAYAERFILEHFIADVQKCTDSKLQGVLHKLRNLHALHLLQNESSFLSFGLVTPAHMETINTEVHRLVKEIRPHALALVDSFGIPDHLLAPIALDYIEYNTWTNTVNGRQFDGKAAL